MTALPRAKSDQPLTHAEAMRREPVQSRRNYRSSRASSLIDTRHAPAALLDERDWIVLRIAATDPRSSLDARFELLRRVVGIRRPPVLANGKLEALRRYAVLLRLDGTSLSQGERDRLGEAGYSAAQHLIIDTAVRCMASFPRHPAPARRASMTFFS